ncbi:hypothetical protein MNKW57_16890 [Biformimicrobium ophioploci]|uniref:Lipoprotein n=1 Tax=Biformimicrobium ophioploci TaxID=3036711 RepID=A0ABQ6LZ65_9GAMM|nr:hypothetical protein MNKW57_16890 [Microbulbifer sp. NKW57]
MKFTPTTYLMGIVCSLLLAGCCSTPAPVMCPAGTEQIPTNMACPSDADCFMVDDNTRCMKVVK